MNDYEKIRTFESEILDKAQIEKEFYQYSEDVVIPFLLQVYGDTERHRDGLIANGHSETSISFNLTNMMHGISHCIRWIKNQDAPRYFTVDNKTFQHIHDMSADFVNWGTIYYSIAQEFILWSRGVKKAILDEENRTITFIQPSNFDYSKVFGLQLLYGNQLQQIYESYPHDEMELEFSDWIKEIDLKNPPIANSINWSKGRQSRSYPLLFSKMGEIIFPELLETTDLEGYNLKQLRQFYALMFLNFHFIRWVEGVIDSNYGVEHAFGSNPLYLDSAQFIRLSVTITGLDFISVSNIIKDLTFDHKNFHSSISIQPFILSKSDIYYILPNLFSQLDPARMIVGALNKGPKKKVYDRLINQIESESLNGIKLILSQDNRWKCYVGKTIKSNGKQYQPDLIVIDHEAKCVAVIDYKHFIGPITASEVEYRMSELEKGINQVNGYLSVVLETKSLAAENISGYSLYGMLLTHKPLPIPLPHNVTIGLSDKSTFNSAVIKCHQNKWGLTYLMKSFTNPDFRKGEYDFTAFDAEVEVMNWKIIRTMHKRVVT